MKLYLAAKWESRDEIQKVAQALTNAGVDIVSTWHASTDERSYDEAMQDEAGMKREAFTCIGELGQSDMIVLDTRVPSKTGGRDFEAGYTMGRMKHIVLIGPPRNPFHYFAWKKFEGWAEFATWFLEYTQRG